MACELAACVADQARGVRSQPLQLCAAEALSRLAARRHTPLEQVDGTRVDLGVTAVHAVRCERDPATHSVSDLVFDVELRDGARRQLPFAEAIDHPLVQLCLAKRLRLQLAMYWAAHASGCTVAEACTFVYDALGGGVDAALGGFYEVRGACTRVAYHEVEPDEGYDEGDDGDTVIDDGSVCQVED
jgi:hypothetical protein